MRIYHIIVCISASLCVTCCGNKDLSWEVFHTPCKIFVTSAPSDLLNTAEANWMAGVPAGRDAWTTNYHGFAITHEFQDDWVSFDTKDACFLLSPVSDGQVSLFVRFTNGILLRKFVDGVSKSPITVSLDYESDRYDAARESEITMELPDKWDKGILPICLIGLTKDEKASVTLVKGDHSDTAGDYGEMVAQGLPISDGCYEVNLTDLPSGTYTLIGIAGLKNVPVSIARSCRHVIVIN